MSHRKRTPGATLRKPEPKTVKREPEIPIKRRDESINRAEYMVPQDVKTNGFYRKFHSETFVAKVQSKWYCQIESNLEK